MLRSFQVRRQVSRPFVCLRCAVRYRHRSSSKDSRRPVTSRILKDGSTAEIRRRFVPGRASRTSLEAQPLWDSNSLPPNEPPPLPRPDLPSIRERLRQWEIDNASAYKPVDVNLDVPEPGHAVNRVIHPNYVEFQEVSETDGLDDYRESNFERFDLVDVGDSRGFLLPGDLVELSSLGNRRQELAIFVRDLGMQTQFYTMTGRWLHRTNNSVKFFVPGFVEPKELDAIRPYLPDGEVDTSLEGRLQSFQDSVALEIGKPLILKMANFWNQADATFQSHAQQLDNAHKTVADVYKFRYASLDEIATKVLGDTINRQDDGKYPWAVLYAVHRTLLKDDIGFRALPHGSYQRTNVQYEINGSSEVDAIRRVVSWVRKYAEIKLSNHASEKKLAVSEVVLFANHARKLIDISRANRQFTSHGMIGPSLRTVEPGERFRAGVPGEAFTANDLYFIRFLESWACLGSFSTHSTLNGVGSSILRAIDRYENVSLDRTTGWTCLQELGALAPWETTAGFDLRLPYTGRQDAIEHRLHPQVGRLAGGLVPDKLKALRKDWLDTPVFCVDDEAAHEIDDGFSLESTDNPNEYWVHVHSADPAALLDPAGRTAQFAESLAETIYLPDRMIPMLAPDWAHANVSLAPNMRCLTFSAKMNLQGELLESKILPGILRNVQYLTPATFQDIASCADVHIAKDNFVVGNHIDTKTVSRLLKTSDQFSEAEREQMKIIHTITGARASLMESKGAITAGVRETDISVSFDGFPWAKPKSPSHSHQYFGDPTIRLAVAKTADDEVLEERAINAVGILMLLAGEVAARWCKERNIPIPYRITPLNPDKQHPYEFFLQNIKHAAKPIPIDTMMNYFSTIGKVQPSTVPGPHAALCMEAFAKVTSPMRRYCDMLAHFQIESALLEEARTGQSLVGSTSHDYLALSKARLDEILPRIAARERQIGRSKVTANRIWAIQLVLRAWKFGEFELPRPLEFTVRSVNPDTNTAGGVVTKMMVGGNMRIPSWASAEDIEIGDRFEVEIDDINTYTTTIVFKALKSLESEAEIAAKKLALATGH